jgi:hypothetical protein
MVQFPFQVFEEKGVVHLIQDKYKKIKAMVAQGKSLDEIETSFGDPTAAPPPNPNGAPPAATLNRSDLQGSAEEELIMGERQLPRCRFGR